MTRQEDRDSVPLDEEGELRVTATIDACGLACPLPLLKAKQGLRRAELGECIRILATDGGSVRDFHSFARLSGNRLRSFHQRDGIYSYVIEKGVQNHS